MITFTFSFHCHWSTTSIASQVTPVRSPAVSTQFHSPRLQVLLNTVSSLNTSLRWIQRFRDPIHRHCRKICRKTYLNQTVKMSQDHLTTCRKWIHIICLTLGRLFTHTEPRSFSAPRNLDVSVCLSAWTLCVCLSVYSPNEQQSSWWERERNQLMSKETRTDGQTDHFFHAIQIIVCSWQM